MDINRLRTGEQIAAVAAIVLLLDMFIFKWFGLEGPGAAIGNVVISGGSVSKNAWGSFSIIDLILFLTVLAALGLAYLSASDTRLDLPVAASIVVAVLGGLSTLLILFRLISPPDLGFDNLPDAVDHTRKFGAWLGLIAAAALTYGAWRAMQDEGASFQEAADRFGGRGGGAGLGPRTGPDVGESPPVGGGPDVGERPPVGGGPDVGAGPTEPPSAPPPPPPPPPPASGQTPPP